MWRRIRWSKAEQNDRKLNTNQSNVFIIWIIERKSQKSTFLGDLGACITCNLGIRIYCIEDPDQQRYKNIINILQWMESQAGM